MLYLHFPLIKPQPKSKFAIFCGCIPRPVFLFINTDINQFVLQTPQVAKDHLPILVADHPTFLAYDSWVDCTQFIGFDDNDLRRQPGSTIKGEICDAMRAQIIACISASALIPAKKKNSVVDALAQRLPIII